MSATNPAHEPSGRAALVSPPSAPRRPERHGPLARAVMVALGLVFAVAFAALAGIGGWSLRSASGVGQALLRVAGTLLCLGIAAYGAHLAWRGLRGHTKPGHLERASSWAGAHRGAAALVALAGNAGLLAWMVWGGGTAGLVALQRGHGEAGARLQWWLTLAIVVWPAHVVVHELGHGAAAWALRFRVISLRAGPLLARRTGRRWRLAWSAAPALGLDGLVMAAPIGDEQLQRRLALLAIGGVSANLAVAGLCAVVLGVIQPPASPGGTVLQGLLTAGVAVGVLALENLWPVTFPSGLRSDGGLLLRALDRTEGGAALRRGVVAGARGQRPASWGVAPDGLLELAALSPRHGGELRLAALAVALDLGDPAAAAQAQAQLLERWAVQPAWLRAQVTYLTALERALAGEPEAAGELLDAAGPGARRSGFLGLLEAAVAVAGSDPRAAREAHRRWRRAVARSGLGPATVARSAWAVDRIRRCLAPASV